MFQIFVFLTLFTLSKQTCDDVFTIPALGDVSGKIGDLYDARGNTFCGLSVFAKDPTDNVIKEHMVDSTTVELSYNQSYENKCETLTIKASFQVKAFMIEIVGGSGRYVNVQTQETNYHGISFIYKLRTVKQAINFHDRRLPGQNVFSEAALDHKTATHVVSGVTWGANFIITIRNPEKIGSAKNTVVGMIGKVLAKLAGTFMGRGKDDFEDLTGEFYVDVIGDILSITANKPGNFKEAYELMKDLPKLVAEVNEGKGVPIAYELYPIKGIPRKKKDKQAEKNADTVQDSIISQVVKLLDELSSVKNRLVQFHKLVSRNKNCVKASDQTQISNLLEHVKHLHDKLKADMTELTLKVKTKEVSVSKISDLIKNFDDPKNNPKRIRQTIRRWSRIRNRINLVKELVTNGSVYLGNGKALEEVLVASPSSCVLFFSEKSFEDDETWINNKLRFFEEIGKAKNNSKGVNATLFFATDCDLQECSGVNKSASVIKKFTAGSVTVEDLVKSDKVIKCPISNDFFKEWDDVAKKLDLIRNHYKTNGTNI